jgi:LEA14-like dessication related protein
LERRLKVPLVLVALLLALALALPALQSYEATGRIEVGAVFLDRVQLTGINLDVGDPVPDTVRLTGRLLVANQADEDITIMEVVYRLTIEGITVGEGRVEGFQVPAHSNRTRPFTLTVSAGRVLERLAGVLAPGSTIQFQVSGRVRVPVNLLGTIPILTIERPFSLAGTFQVPDQGGTRSGIPFQVTAYWSTPETRRGSQVNAIVEVVGPVTGYLEVQIIKDTVYRAERPVQEEAFIVDLEGGQVERFTVRFRPEEATRIPVLGYYIVVYLNGQKVFEQENAYPPRLRVT